MIKSSGKRKNGIHKYIWGLQIVLLNSSTSLPDKYTCVAQLVVFKSEYGCHPIPPTTHNGARRYPYSPINATEGISIELNIWIAFRKPKILLASALIPNSSLGFHVVKGLKW